MNQYLSEPLNKHLIKLVNQESEQDWGKRDEKVPFPKYEKPKKVELTVGIWNLIRQFKI